MKRLSLWHSDKGVAAVEFALILPLFLAVLLGAVDFAMFYHDRLEMDELAHAAAQYILQGGKETDLTANIVQPSSVYKEAQAQSRAVTYTMGQQCQCANGSSVNCTSGSCPAGDYVHQFYAVTVQSTYKPIFPWPGVPGTIQLTGFARMQYGL